MAEIDGGMSEGREVGGIKERRDGRTEGTKEELERYNRRRKGGRDERGKKRGIGGDYGTEEETKEEGNATKRERERNAGKKREGLEK